MQLAIRHPERVKKVVSISSVIRHDGWVKEGVEAFSRMDPAMFKGSPFEAEYKKLSPTPDQFEKFVKHMMQTVSKPYDFGADKLKATKAPMFFIHGDADGVRLDQQKNAPAVAHAALAAEQVTRGLVGRTVAEVERDLILETLKHCLGNRTHAANVLGISIRTLRNKLNEYSADGVPVPPPGGGEPKAAA